MKFRRLLAALLLAALALVAAACPRAKVAVCNDDRGECDFTRCVLCERTFDNHNGAAPIVVPCRHAPTQPGCPTPTPRP